MSKSKKHICDSDISITNTTNTTNTNTNSCINDISSSIFEDNSSIDIITKVKTLNIYYNLLLEKIDFCTANITELEDKLKCLKNKICVLSHRLCIQDNILKNQKPLYWIIEDQFTKGTNGGTAQNCNWISKKYDILKLSSSLNPDDNTINLNATSFTVHKGCYNIDISMTFVRTGLTKIRLFNITNNTIVDESLAHNIINCNNTNNSIINLSTIVYLDNYTEFAVQYMVQYKIDNYGLGLSSGFSDTEKYSVIKIIKYFSKELST